MKPGEGIGLGILRARSEGQMEVKAVEKESPMVLVRVQTFG